MHIAFTERCFGFIPLRGRRCKAIRLLMESRWENLPHVGFDDTWYQKLQQFNELAVHGLFEVRGSEGFLLLNAPKSR